MPKVSVIIPIYQVEKYIEKCIKSILNQTYKDFELILVDDRSPDGSIIIAIDLLKAQRKIPYQVISKQNNEGLSAARNSGIDAAKGDFLLFIDSDDWIEHKMLERMIDSAISQKVEMVMCRARQVYEATANVDFLNSMKPGILSGKQALLGLFDGKYHAHIWKILFARSLFDEIRFPEGVIYEDMLTLPYLLIKAKKVRFIDNVFYNYLQRHTSITKSFDPEIIKVPHQINMMESKLSPLLDKNQMVSFKRYIYSAYLILVEHASFLSPNYEHAKAVLMYCKKEIKTITLINQFTKRPSRSSLLLLLLKISPKLFYRKYK